MDGWDCTFSVDFPEWYEKKHDTSVIQLVKEFFVYYGTKDLSALVISPILGRTISRDIFQEAKENTLPTILHPMLKEVKANGLKFFNNFLSPLSVQDPFEQIRNISKGLNEKSFSIFRMKCIRASSICQDIEDRQLPLSKLFEPIKLTKKEIQEGTGDFVKFVPLMFAKQEKSQTSLSTTEEVEDIIEAPQAGGEEEEEDSDCVVLSDEEKDPVPVVDLEEEDQGTNSKGIKA